MIVGHLLCPDKLIKVTIDRGKSSSERQVLGYTRFKDPMPFISTASHFADSIAIFLAGMAAERLVYGDHFMGSGGNATADLVMATDIATMMERTVAFGDSLLTDMGSGSRPMGLPSSKVSIVPERSLPSILGFTISRMTRSLSEMFSSSAPHCGPTIGFSVQIPYWQWPRPRVA